MLEKILYSTPQLFYVFSFTLPHHKNIPTLSHQIRYILGISPNVLVEFGIPELFIRSRSRTSWTAVLMPEAAMNEDSLLSISKYYIRCSGKPTYMKPISVTQTMHQAANLHLGFRVPTLDSAHYSASNYA